MAHTTYIDNIALKVCYTVTANTFEHYLIRTVFIRIEAAVLFPFCAKFVIVWRIQKELKL